MWTISRGIKFKKDYKKVKSSGRFDKEAFDKVLEMLLRREPLPEDAHDHPLQGNQEGKRDCHINGDLVLIYKVDEEKQEIGLVRLGNHSELFG